MFLFFIVLGAFFKGSISFVDKVFAHSQTKIANWSVYLNNINVQNLSIIDKNENNDQNILEINTIAPGTKGEFNIDIDFSKTEVGIKYKVIFNNETKKPQNLKFIFEEKIYDNLKDLEKILEGNIYVSEEIKQKTFNIKWFWNYETGEDEKQIKENDLKDTEDIKSIKSYSFDVEVLAFQLEPNEIKKEGE